MPLKAPKTLLSMVLITEVLMTPIWAGVIPGKIWLNKVPLN